jgi:hypothetical protein
MQSRREKTYLFPVNLVMINGQCKKTLLPLESVLRLLGGEAKALLHCSGE